MFISRAVYIFPVECAYIVVKIENDYDNSVFKVMPLAGLADPGDLWQRIQVKEIEVSFLVDT